MARQVIRFQAKRDGSLWHGIVVLPFGPAQYGGGGVAVPPRQEIRVQASSGTSKSDALAKAAGLAEQIASNPIVQAALPPGAGAAISALKLLGKSGAADGMKKIVGEGAKRIASALKFW